MQRRAGIEPLFSWDLLMDFEIAPEGQSSVVLSAPGTAAATSVLQASFSIPCRRFLGTQIVISARFKLFKDLCSKTESSP